MTRFADSFQLCLHIGLVTAVTFSPGPFLCNIQAKYFNSQPCQVLKASPKVNVKKKSFRFVRKTLQELVLTMDNDSVAVLVSISAPSPAL